MSGCGSYRSCNPCNPSKPALPKKKAPLKKKPNTKKKTVPRAGTNSNACRGGCGTCCSKKAGPVYKKAPVQKKYGCSAGQCDYYSDSSHSSGCSCSDCYSYSDSDTYDSYTESSDEGCYQYNGQRSGCCRR